MNDQKTLMLFGAHHDDNELNAGTIARHVKAGWRVVSVVVTKSRWTAQRVSDENIEIRGKESLAAAKLLGMETNFLGFDEAGLTETVELMNACTTTMRRHGPNVIVTHPPVDYHSDHMVVSRCVEDAWYRCANSAHECGEPALTHVPSLYYCDAWCTPFTADLYVDVTDYMQIKKDALACHVTQLGPNGPAPGDMIDLEIARARYRGMEAGMTYAEAFRFVPKAGKMRVGELLE